MKLWATASTLLAIVALGSAHTDSIGPGSLAPAMQIKTWLKGNPISSFDKNKLYVVEFWATWCGPCKQSIPHLTELAKKNTDVTFVGVSIWEDDKGGNIKQFVDTMGDKMDYNVAYSGNKTGMAQSWMQASGQNGIPTAFVIKGGKIEWIGHPMSLEGPLEQIKAGKFDEAAFKVAFTKEQKAAVEQKAAYSALTTNDNLYRAGKKAEAKAGLEKMVKEHPDMAAGAYTIRLGWLAKDDIAGWRKMVTEYTSSGDPVKISSVSEFAMNQLHGGNKDLGKEAIETALSNTKNSDFFTLYYGTLFFQETKDFSTALTTCNRLLEVLPNSQFKDNKEVADDFKKMQGDLTKKLGDAKSK